MDKRLITRHVRKARDRIRDQISRGIRPGDHISAGLAWEGYDGGYYHALNDVLLMLESDTIPTRQNYWERSR